VGPTFDSGRHGAQEVHGAGVECDLDPERETPAVLGGAARASGVDPHSVGDAASLSSPTSMVMAER
jgi:hypothetical protein